MTLNSCCSCLPTSQVLSLCCAGNQTPGFVCQASTRHIPSPFLVFFPPTLVLFCMQQPKFPLFVYSLGLEFLSALFPGVPLDEQGHSLPLGWPAP